MSISVPTKVVTNGGGGRLGTAIYDSGITSNTAPAVIVLFDDSTYGEYTRGELVLGTSGFVPGTGV